MRLQEVPYPVRYTTVYCRLGKKKKQRLNMHVSKQSSQFNHSLGFDVPSSVMPVAVRMGIGVKRACYWRRAPVIPVALAYAVRAPARVLVAVLRCYELPWTGEPPSAVLGHLPHSSAVRGADSQQPRTPSVAPVLVLLLLLVCIHN